MKKNICFIATVEFALLTAMLEHIRAMDDLYNVSVAVNTADVHFLDAFGVRAFVQQIGFKREISPTHDFLALMQLIRFFRQKRFDVVHSNAPKSGLLAMLAGYLTGIPFRVHTFTGQVWATREGLSRWYLRRLDRLLASLATHILVDSPSQREFLIREGVVSAEKARVLAHGSVCGVDVKKVAPDPVARKQMRNRIGIPDADVVFLFLGRLTRDKGLMELACAFGRLCESRGNVRLMLVGPDEEEMRPKIIEACGPHANRVHFEGYTRFPQSYLAAADIFCLPSCREGFGSVIIEAAAVGIPSIGTRIYGITDAIEEGKTGVLCEPRDAGSLERCMDLLAGDSALREIMGRCARERVLRDFSSAIVTEALLAYYRALFDGTGSRG